MADSAQGAGAAEGGAAGGGETMTFMSIDDFQQARLLYTAQHRAVLTASLFFGTHVLHPLPIVGNGPAAAG